VAANDSRDRPTSDPSLDSDPAAGAFPDTAVGTHLVLYQTADGEVELRWQVDPEVIAHARGAFADPSAQPLLRLYLKGEGGVRRVLANADLDDDAAACSGRAHYGGDDAEGLLQAEIGIATGDGGWMLVARSNGLAAAGPVGVSFLREFSDVVDRSGPARTASEPSGNRAANLSSAEFPLVQPDPSVAGGAAGTLRADGIEPPLNPSSPERPSGSAIEPASGAPEPRSPLAPGAPGEVGGAAALPDPPPPVSSPPAEGVVPRLDRAARHPDEGSPEQAGDPAHGEPPAKDAAGAAEAPSPASGSGPIHRGAADASLTADLVVHGRAPPNTLLDLGGHPYRVGAGGRFVLRIPVQDPELVRRLLATLPRLPVADRDDDA
jgi:hypothetical protein